MLINIFCLKGDIDYVYKLIAPLCTFLTLRLLFDIDSDEIMLTSFFSGL